MSRCRGLLIGTVYPNVVRSVVLWAGHVSRHVQGDKSPEREFKTIWALLLYYKKPTDRLKWHLTRCISWKYIPRGMLDI